MLKIPLTLRMMNKIPYSRSHFKEAYSILNKVIDNEEFLNSVVGFTLKSSVNSFFWSKQSSKTYSLIHKKSYKINDLNGYHQRSLVLK